MPVKPEYAEGPTNKARAFWAEMAVNSFTAAKGEILLCHYKEGEKADWETEIQDLISDLLHFARRKGIDVADMLSRAVGHFDFETKNFPED